MMISITRFPPAIFSAMAEKSATSPTSAARIELLKARLGMGGGGMKTIPAVTCDDGIA